MAAPGFQLPQPAGQLFLAVEIVIRVQPLHEEELARQVPADERPGAGLLGHDVGIGFLHQADVVAHHQPPAARSRRNHEHDRDQAHHRPAAPAPQVAVASRPVDQDRQSWCRHGPGQPGIPGEQADVGEQETDAREQRHALHPRERREEQPGETDQAGDEAERDAGEDMAQGKLRRPSVAQAEPVAEEMQGVVDGDADQAGPEHQRQQMNLPEHEEAARRTADASRDNRQHAQAEWLPGPEYAHQQQDDPEQGPRAHGGNIAVGGRRPGDGMGQHAGHKKLGTGEVAREVPAQAPELGADGLLQGNRERRLGEVAHHDDVALAARMDREKAILDTGAGQGTLGTFGEKPGQQQEGVARDDPGTDHALRPEIAVQHRAFESAAILLLQLGAHLMTEDLEAQRKIEGGGLAWQVRVLAQCHLPELARGDQRLANVPGRRHGGLAILRPDQDQELALEPPLDLIDRRPRSSGFGLREKRHEIAVDHLTSEKGKREPYRQRDDDRGPDDGDPPTSQGRPSPCRSAGRNSKATFLNRMTVRSPPPSRMRISRAKSPPEISMPATRRAKSACFGVRVSFQSSAAPEFERNLEVALKHRHVARDDGDQGLG